MYNESYQNLACQVSKLCILADRQKLLLSCLSVFRATPAHWIMSNIATGLSLTIPCGEGCRIEIVGISVEGYPGTVCGNADEI